MTDRTFHYEWEATFTCALDHHEDNEHPCSMFSSGYGTTPNDCDVRSCIPLFKEKGRWSRVSLRFRLIIGTQGVGLKDDWIYG